MRKFSLLAPACALLAAVLLHGQAAYAEPTIAELEQQIEAKSADLEMAVEQYNQLNEQLKTARVEIDGLQQSIGPLQQRAAQGQTRVAELARSAYQTGGVSGVTALLSSKDGTEALMRLGALRQVAQSQKRELTRANELAAQHAATVKVLQQKTAEIESRLKTIAAQRKGIERELDKLNEIKVRARGTTTSGSSAPYTGVIPQVSGKAGIAVTFAFQAIGKPYVWAAAGPNGYDCSGLTLAAWRAAGVSLAHYTVTQWNQTARINRADLAPGDLVFYSGLGHVALYIGDNRVIHAPTFGDHVKISSLDMMTPYGYGRVV